MPGKADDKDRKGSPSTETESENGTKPKPVVLRSARDFTLTVQALASRHEELTKLVKKTSDEGYPRESRVIAADAAAIQDIILPQFKHQQEFPLVTTERLQAAIGEAFRGLVRKYLPLARSRDAQTDAIRSEEDVICEQIALRVEAYAVEIAGKAYAAGYAARGSDPEAIALRSVSSLAISPLQ